MARLSIITDSAGKVVDFATNVKNLSRGYAFLDFRKYVNVEVLDVRIDDVFDGEILTPNNTERQKIIDEIANEKKIQERQRKIAIDSLKSSGELPEDFVDEAV